MTRLYGTFLWRMLRNNAYAEVHHRAHDNDSYVWTVTDPRWMDADGGCAMCGAKRNRRPFTSPGTMTSPTPFQTRVYDLVRTIPAGSVTTYASLALQLNTSARAIGGAMGKNPFKSVP